jgi:predicted dehydrogenase
MAATGDRAAEAGSVNSKEQPVGLVVGYGSIGRRHARVLAGMTSRLAIVNRRDTVRLQAIRDHPQAQVVPDLESLDRTDFPWSVALAVIATWGPSHAEYFHRLADRGVRRILCEKPMATSVRDAFTIVARAEREGISLGVNHCLRFANVVPALLQFFEDHSLGEPYSVVASGGASCLVTNGIHWLDFAVEMFGAEPEEVVACTRGDAINPRSPDLLYYGGSAVWRFAGDCELVMAFNNSSSVEPTVRIYLPDAIAEVSYAQAGGDVFVHSSVWRANTRPPASDPGPFGAGQRLFEGRLPGVRLFMEGIEEALWDVWDRGAARAPARTGAAAVSSVIGALLSGREGTAVRLPIDPGSTWGGERWPVS